VSFVPDTEKYLAVSETTFEAEVTKNVTQLKNSVQTSLEAHVSDGFAQIDAASAAYLSSVEQSGSLVKAVGESASDIISRERAIGDELVANASAVKTAVASASTAAVKYLASLKDNARASADKRSTDLKAAQQAWSAQAQSDLLGWSSDLQASVKSTVTSLQGQIDTATSEAKSLGDQANKLISARQEEITSHASSVTGEASSSTTSMSEYDAFLAGQLLKDSEEFESRDATLIKTRAQIGTLRQTVLSPTLLSDQLTKAVTAYADEEANTALGTFDAWLAKSKQTSLIQTDAADLAKLVEERRDEAAFERQTDAEARRILARFRSS